MWSQLGIMLFGVSAIWLVGSKRREVRRWAYLCGLAAQPFWLATAIGHEQWGIAAMCGLYGASWARGAWNHWVAPA